MFRILNYRHSIIVINYTKRLYWQQQLPFNISITTHCMLIFIQLFDWLIIDIYCTWIGNASVKPHIQNENLHVNGAFLKWRPFFTQFQKIIIMSVLCTCWLIEVLWFLRLNKIIPFCDKEYILIRHLINEFWYFCTRCAMDVINFMYFYVYERSWTLNYTGLENYLWWFHAFYSCEFKRVIHLLCPIKRGKGVWAPLKMQKCLVLRLL